MSKFWKKIFTSKYTGKQIDEAVGKVLDGDVGMTNPMTAAGDIIIGGTDGEPEKLAKGTDGKVLKMVSGAPGWADDAGGMENPMTTAGDMIIGGADGAATRLPKGTDGQVLTLASGAPAWAAAQGGGHLYWHTVNFNGNVTSLANYTGFLIILSTSAAPLTTTTFAEFVSANINADIAIVSGSYYDGQSRFELVKLKYLNDSNCKVYYLRGNAYEDITAAYSGLTITDAVNQIM